MKHYCAKLSKLAMTRDGNRQLLYNYVEDDVKGIDISDCTSKSQERIGIYPWIM